MRVLQATEAWNAHGEWVSKSPEGALAEEIRSRFYAGKAIDKSVLQRAREVRERLIHEIDDLLDEYGVIAIPTVTEPALPISATKEQRQDYRKKITQITCLSSLAGLPEISLPLVVQTDFRIGLYANASLPPVIVHMVGMMMMASAVSGCRYCTARTANKSFEIGVDKEKIADIWNFESSEHFDAAERAALSFAMAAGQSPSLVEQSHYDALHQHFSEKEIVEILFIICQFGFWNRWNDSVGTQLEDTPKSFSQNSLPEEQWVLGKHGE